MRLGTRLASTTFPTFMGEIAFKGRGFRDVQRTGPGGLVQAPETREATSGLKLKMQRDPQKFEKLKQV